MIMRIDWSKTPKYMLVIKPVFGNLGKVVDRRECADGRRVYRLNSVVEGAREMNYDFYDNEVSVSAE